MGKASTAAIMHPNTHPIMYSPTKVAQDYHALMIKSMEGNKMLEIFFTFDFYPLHKFIRTKVGQKGQEK